MSAQTNAAEMAYRHACHAAEARAAGNDAGRKYHEREVILWARWLVRAAELSTHYNQH